MVAFIAAAFTAERPECEPIRSVAALRVDPHGQCRTSYGSANSRGQVSKLASALNAPPRVNVGQSHESWRHAEARALSYEGNARKVEIAHRADQQALVRPSPPMPPPNPSLHPKAAYSGLRPLPASGELKR
jgi:hypothetical protein